MTLTFVPLLLNAAKRLTQIVQVSGGRARSVEHHPMLLDVSSLVS